MRHSPLWLAVLLVHCITAQAAPPPLTATVDFTGNGTKVHCTLAAQQASKDEPFSDAVLKVGKETKALGEDFYGFSCDLRPFTVSSDSKRQVLVASASAESDFEVHLLFTMDGGKLKQVGRIEGQGGMTIPGNGSLIAKSWMGFWTKTEKHVFAQDLTLSLMPQEFYSVNVEGTVLKSFPVYQMRDGKTVLATTRKDSKFKVLLWDPASRKVEKDGDNEIENLETQWYLIRTESGFTGWVQGRSLQGEFAELPWAG